MKKKIVSLLLALMLICLSAACKGREENAGEWELRAAEYVGLYVQPEVLGIYAKLSLDKDGTGRLTIDENGYWIKSWSVKDGKIKITMLDDAVEGTVKDGYIILVFEDDISLWFAKEGSDVPPLQLLDEDGYMAAYEAMVESGDAMPID